MSAQQQYRNEIGTDLDYEPWIVRHISRLMTPMYIPRMPRDVAPLLVSELRYGCAAGFEGDLQEEWLRRAGARPFPEKALRRRDLMDFVEAALILHRRGGDQTEARRKAGLLLVPGSEIAAAVRSGRVREALALWTAHGEQVAFARTAVHVMREADIDPTEYMPKAAVLEAAMSNFSWAFDDTLTAGSRAKASSLLQGRALIDSLSGELAAAGDEGLVRRLWIRYAPPGTVSRFLAVPEPQREDFGDCSP